MNTTNPEMMTDNQIRTDYERLLEENTILKNEITQSMKILREANCEILGDVKDGVTKDQLKKDNERVLAALKTFKDAVVEALGGPKFNEPYEGCIRLRDITCEIEGLKKQNDELLLKETKTHNENVALQSELEELEKANKEIKSISYNLAEDVRKLVEENEEQVASIHDLEKELKEIKEVKKIVTEVATQTETDGLQEEIDKLKKEKEETDEEIIENYFANEKLRETTWKEWNNMNEALDILKKNNEDGCKLIKALMDKLHPLTARVLGVAQYLVENPYYEGEDNVIERSTICDLLGFTPEFLTEFEENGGKVAKDLGAVMAKYVVDEVKEEEEKEEDKEEDKEEEEKFCADCDIPHKCEDCVKEE